MFCWQLCGSALGCYDAFQGMKSFDDERRREKYCEELLKVQNTLLILFKNGELEL
jgi:hypothetical protein